MYIDPYFGSYSKITMFKAIVSYIRNVIINIVVYINGKRDEGKTYYSGGSTKEYKIDAENTAKLMVRP